MKNENRKRNKDTVVLVVIFGLYMVALVTAVLLKYGLKTGLGSLNLIPFQWLSYPKDIVFKNVFGNIASFVPFGLLLPLLFRQMHIAKTILAGFFLSLFFETVQYVTDTGGADVDDLILNTCGVLWGALLFLLLKRCTHDEAQLRRVGIIVVIAFGGIAAAVLLFV